MNIDELNLPIDEFVVRCHELIPASYGKMMVKKIAHDSKNKMSPVDDYEERGDLKLRWSPIQSDDWEYYEVKTSYLNKSGRFTIKNIRPWQDFDYFILCLIDTSNNNYKTHFYCLNKEVIIDNPVLVFTGQNNTKISNENNTNVAISTTFGLNDHSWLFDEDNRLYGTTYDNLMSYLNIRSFDKSVWSERSNWDKLDRGGRRPIQKIYLEMEDSTGQVIIDGLTNKEVMINLVEYIGPSKLDGIIWRTWLSKSHGDDRTEYVGDGYYFNPKFSIRDLTTTINQINKKLNFSFNIKNK